MSSFAFFFLLSFLLNLASNLDLLIVSFFPLYKGYFLALMNLSIWAESAKIFFSSSDGEAVVIKP